MYEYGIAQRDLSSLQGEWLRDYEAMPQRQHHSEIKETLGAVAPSNAYRRRVAGVNWA